LLRKEFASLKSDSRHSTPSLALALKGKGKGGTQGLRVASQGNRVVEKREKGREGVEWATPFLYKNRIKKGVLL
jgi:hypothetical protein